VATAVIAFFNQAVEAEHLHLYSQAKQAYDQALKIIQVSDY
jgi:purine-nucleoside phosphorylase